MGWPLISRGRSWIYVVLAVLEWDLSQRLVYQKLNFGCSMRNSISNSVASKEDIGLRDAIFGKGITKAQGIVFA